MSSRQLAWIVFPLAVIFLSGAARGEIVAQYSFTDVEAGTLNRNATTVAANVTAGSITDAPIVFTHPMVTLTRATGIGYDTQPVLAAARAPWNESNIRDNVYFTLTVAPESGYELDLSDLAFNVAQGGGTAGTRDYEIRTSLDDFASSFTGIVPIPTVRPVFTPVSVDLSAATFQNLTSPITFQFRFYTPGFSQNIDFDDITLNGAVAAVSPVLSGDYNGNGTVDAADYIVWRGTLGSMTDLRANGDDTGDSAGRIDEADLVVWKSQFGTSSSGLGSVSLGLVPEPSSVALGLFAVAGLGAFAKRR